MGFSVFFSWVIRSEKASHIIDFEKKIEEEEIFNIPGDVSNANIEHRRKDLDFFQLLFIPDAWSAVHFFFLLVETKKSKNPKLYPSNGCKTNI